MPPNNKRQIELEKSLVSLRTQITVINDSLENLKEQVMIVEKGIENSINIYKNVKLLPVNAVKTSTKKSKPTCTESIKKFGFKMKRILGDGNCMFRAIYDQLYPNWSNQDENNEYLTVKRLIINWISKHWNDDVPEGLKGVDEDGIPDKRAYLKKMRKPNEWGDQACVYAAAQLFKRNVVIIKCPPNGSDIYILSEIKIPNAQGSINLYYENDNHYNSLYTLK